jgi:hypothetical protein
MPSHLQVLSNADCILAAESDVGRTEAVEEVDVVRLLVPLLVCSLLVDVGFGDTVLSVFAGKDGRMADVRGGNLSSSLVPGTASGGASVTGSAVGLLGSYAGGAPEGRVIDSAVSASVRAIGGS